VRWAAGVSTAFPATSAERSTRDPDRGSQQPRIHPGERLAERRSGELDHRLCLVRIGDGLIGEVERLDKDPEPSARAAERKCLLRAKIEPVDGVGADRFEVLWQSEDADSTAPGLAGRRSQGRRDEG